MFLFEKKYYIHNIFTIIYNKLLYVSNLKLPLKLLFCLPETINKNLKLRIYFENIINIIFILLKHKKVLVEHGYKAQGKMNIIRGHFVLILFWL